MRSLTSELWMNTTVRTSHIVVYHEKEGRIGLHMKKIWKVTKNPNLRGKIRFKEIKNTKNGQSHV